MPPPFEALETLVCLTDDALSRRVPFGGLKPSVQFALYELLRQEQALAAAAQPASRTEAARILDFAQIAYGELIGLLVGRDDATLESARDGEWSLRDLLRHAVAVELRYAAQVEYSASRSDEEPARDPGGAIAM